MGTQRRLLRHTPESQPSVRRPYAGLGLFIVALVAAALCAACSAQATMGTAPTSGGAASSPAATDDGARAKTAGGADWAHVLQVVAYLRAAPPAEPVVILLGGSSARESTISDSSWQRQIEAKGGPATQPFNLGSRNRTMAQNVALVKALPKVPTIVYIGVNVGAFTSAQKTARIKLPSGVTSTPAYKQHAYSSKRILTAANKRMLAKAWRTDRYPVFQRNFGTSAGVLDKLVKLCKTRDLRPVLLELPRNTAIIGHQLDKPIARYRAKCKTLARKHHVPFVSFVAAARLQNRDFYDLWHLVEPGRKVWQGLLSAKTAKLLRQYGYDAGG